MATIINQQILTSMHFLVVNIYNGDHVWPHNINGLLIPRSEYQFDRNKWEIFHIYCRNIHIFYIICLFIPLYTIILLWMKGCWSTVIGLVYGV
jgi:hypothetical protein